MGDVVFPHGFLWGAATSAHQVEGNNIHSDWWAWEKSSRVREASGLACDHYRRFVQDFDIAVQLAHNAHRFSVEWSRIEPRPGEFDDKALTHYVEVVKALRERHLEPIVTLHHFTSPQWLIEKGGWLNRKAVDWFARYVERVVKALGPFTRYWVTINEPMVFVNMHYIEGQGPPGGVSFKQALRVVQHLIYAHATAYRVIHDAAANNGWQVRVSIAKQMPVFMPCRNWWPPDRIVSALTDRIFSAAVLQVLTEGIWSVPGIARWRAREAKETLDYLGVNFYCREFIRWSPFKGKWLGSRCDLGHHSEVTERTSMGWDVHPCSFFKTLMRASSLRLPILVTENGTSMHDDEKRWSYISRHLAAMASAVSEGANVIGYCYWSLMDNFEWAEGYSSQFGLVEINYKTQERSIRKSGYRYAEVCRTNRLTLPA